MAVQLPQGMYSGFTETLDSNPTANRFAQLKMKREAMQAAKEDATEEYVRGLSTKINAAGKRVQDIPAFENMYNKWRKYGMENKDKLNKNDIPTRTEFDRQYQEMLSLVNESKSEEEKKKPLVEILLDPNKRNRLSTKTFDAIKLHDDPLYTQDESGNFVRNRDRKSLDYNSTLFDPQFDMAKGFEGWAKGMDRGKSIGEIIKRDPATGQVIRGFTEEYSPNQIKQISANAARSVLDNPDYGNYYQHKYESLKEPEYEQLNKAFQSVYGSTIKLNGQTMPNYIDSPEEVAAAEAIIQAQSLAKKGEEAVLDRELANQRSVNKIYINDGLIRGRKNTGFGPTNTEDGNEFDRIPLPKKTGWFSSGNRVKPEDIPALTKAVLKTAGVNIEDMDYFEADVKDGVIQSITPYWKDKEGELHKEGVITRTDMENAQLKYNSEPQKGNQPSFGNPVRPPKDIKQTKMVPTKKRPY